MLNGRSWRVVAVVVALLALVGGSARAQYSVVDLGTLGGSESIARALNDQDAVVGSSTTPSGAYRAFRWANGVMEGLPPDGESTFSEAVDINNAGVIVGNTSRERAEIWVGQPIHLDGIGGGRSRAAAVKVGAVTVGSSEIPGSAARAAVQWTLGGRLRRLDSLGGQASEALAANELGQVAGWASTASGESHAVLWHGIHPTDLGTLGGVTSRATAVNNSLDVVGVSQDSDGFGQAFIWRSGAMIGLTSPGQESIAYGLNHSGLIVGSYRVSPESVPRACLWRDGECIDLTEELEANSGWHLRAAYDINRAGCIVGVGTHDGLPRGFLIAPKLNTHRSGTVDAAGTGPTNVVLINGEVGSCTDRRAVVRAGEHVSLTLMSAPRTSSDHGHWALWIYEGESFDRVAVQLRTRGGTTFTIGDANACLPLANSIAPGSCAAPLADVLGVGQLGLTSKHLSATAAARFLVSPTPALPSPTDFLVTFPPGTFTIYSVHEDHRSQTSPALHLSVGNTIVVESIP